MARYLVRFRLCGDLRFLSHLDLMRLLERACRRAELPLRFSQGFNPRPAAHLPVPHAVGVEGWDEPAIIDLNEAIEPDEVARRLGAELPPEGRPVSALPADTRERFRPEWAEFRIALPDDVSVPTPETIAAMLARDTIPIVRLRDAGKDRRELDIRRFVLSARFGPPEEDLAADSTLPQEPALWVRVAVTDSGSARPEEVLTALGLSPEDRARCTAARARVHLRRELPKPGSTKAVKPADGTEPDAELETESLDTESLETVPPKGWENQYAPELVGDADAGAAEPNRIAALPGGRIGEIVADMIGDRSEGSFRPNSGESSVETDDPQVSPHAAGDAGSSVGSAVPTDGAASKFRSAGAVAAPRPSIGDDC